MTELANQYPQAQGLVARTLRQAARELLLAQASDWPFILRDKTSPEYARRRVKDHLLRFIALYEQLTVTGTNKPGSMKSSRGTTCSRTWIGITGAEIPLATRRGKIRGAVATNRPP